MQKGRIEPHRSLISSFALFFLFLVTDCELGIGFQKELCGRWVWHARPPDANHLIYPEKQLLAVSVGHFLDGSPMTMRYNHKHSATEKRLWNHLEINRNSSHAYGKSVSWSWNILHGKMVGFFQQSPIHSEQVLEEQKEKGKKERGVGGLGFDWAILAFNAKWPNRTPQESHFFFCSFLSFFGH
jgi:hypothetical protein